MCQKGRTLMAQNCQKGAPPLAQNLEGGQNGYFCRLYSR